MFKFATLSTAEAMVNEYGADAAKLFGGLAGTEAKILVARMAQAKQEEAKETKPVKADKPAAPAPAPKTDKTGTETDAHKPATARKARTRKPAVKAAKAS